MYKNTPLLQQLKKVCRQFIQDEIDDERFIDILDGFTSHASDEELKAMAKILYNNL